mmetsp:Transcript_15303/g.27837  ORF Transcript_15303/g.27837 Transcript_15303/m.27837 type:complete len:102 (+) Transcript_15303:45-350(+)
MVQLDIALCLTAQKHPHIVVSNEPIVTFSLNLEMRPNLSLSQSITKIVSTKASNPSIPSSPIATPHTCHLDHANSMNPSTLLPMLLFDAAISVLAVDPQKR